MGFSDIPDRLNSQTITASWFNSIKTQGESGDTSLSDHEALTSGVHGATGAVVGTTNLQTLSNKTLNRPYIDGASYDGGTASTYNYIKVPAGTTGEITALTRRAGALYWSTDELKYYGDDGTDLTEIGGGDYNVPKPILSVSANKSLTDSEVKEYQLIAVTTGSSANVTVTLPAPSIVTSYPIKIQKVDSGTKFVEIAPNGSENLGGSNRSMYLVLINESMTITSDGTNYLVETSFQDRTMFVNVNAVDTINELNATTSFKTRVLTSVEGDSLGSVSSNRLTLYAGKYKIRYAVGAYNATEGVVTRVYNFTDSSVIKDFGRLSINFTGITASLNTAEHTFTLTSTKALEFQTKAETTSGREFFGRITVERIGD